MNIPGIIQAGLHMCRYPLALQKQTYVRMVLMVWYDVIFINSSLPGPWCRYCRIPNTEYRIPNTNDTPSMVRTGERDGPFSTKFPI